MFYASVLYIITELLNALSTMGPPSGEIGDEDKYYLPALNQQYLQDSILQPVEVMIKD